MRGISSLKLLALEVARGSSTSSCAPTNIAAICTSTSNFVTQGFHTSAATPASSSSTALHAAPPGGQQQEASLHVQLEPLDGANEGIFFLSLTRPAAKNAIGRQLLRELREALDNLSQERTTRCIVVRSTAPGVFCAGADLKERSTMTQQEAATFVSDLRATFTQLENLPIPTIAAVDGFALGGGAELALACDLRVCGRDAQFAFPETRLGIIPGAGGTQRLPRVVGVPRAKELIFTARRVDAHEAYRLGLADQVAESGTGEESALALAREIALAGPIALRMAKTAINVGVDASLRTGLKLEEACYAQVLPTEDRLEGLKAFAEKRAPRFTGE